MDLLKVSNDIEEALKKEGLVGQRLGSGFCFWTIPEMFSLNMLHKK